MKLITFNDKYGNRLELDAALIPLSKATLKAVAEHRKFSERMSVLAADVETITMKAADGEDVSVLTERMLATKTEMELNQARLTRLERDSHAAVCADVGAARAAQGRVRDEARTERQNCKAESKAAMVSELGKRPAEAARMHGLRPIAEVDAEKKMREGEALYGKLEKLHLSISEKAWIESRIGYAPGPTEKYVPDFKQNCAALLRQLGG